MEHRCKYRVIHDSLTHLTKSVHLNGGKYFSMPHPRIETPQVNLYTLPPHRPRLRHSAFAPVPDLAHDCRRPGAASMTIKIAWSNAMRFFLTGICAGLCISATCTAGCACAGKTNHRCHLGNRSWHAPAGMGENGLSAWRLSCHKGRSRRALMRYAKKKLGVFLFPSVGRVLAVLSVNQLYRYYEMRQGIMNNTEFNWEGNTEVRGESATCVSRSRTQITPRNDWDWTMAPGVSGRWIAGVA